MTDMDAVTDVIISGRLSEIPSLPKRTVKVYICSNKSGESYVVMFKYAYCIY